MNKKIPNKLSELIMGLIILLTIIGVSAGLIIKKTNRLKNDKLKKEYANTIQINLEKFYDDQNQYPSKLLELAPIYMPEIPPAINNTPWEYMPSPNNSRYILKINLENQKDDGLNVTQESGKTYYQLYSKK